MPSQNCACCAPKQPFLAQNGPQTRAKRPNEGKPLIHYTCGLTSPCQRALYWPSTPRYVRETAQKGAKKPQNLPNVHQHPETKHGPYLGLRASKSDSEGTYSTRNPPLFVVSKRQIRPTRRLDPRTSGHLVEPEGSPSRARRGPTVGPPGSRGDENYFSKVDPRPLGMLKQVFLANFEPVVTLFGPWKIPKCLKNGPFWDQKWVKNGSKTCFNKRDPGPFGMLKQVFLHHFEPIWTCFGPWKIPKCLENGPFWDQKWVKNGSTTRFCKSDPGPFGMLKQVFLAHFEPICTGFGPWKSQYSLKRGRFGIKNG